MTLTETEGGRRAYLVEMGAPGHGVAALGGVSAAGGLGLHGGRRAGSAGSGLAGSGG